MPCHALPASVELTDFICLLFVTEILCVLSFCDSLKKHIKFLFYNRSRCWPMEEPVPVLEKCFRVGNGRLAALPALLPAK
jgi:hypothetical protein